MDQNPLFFELQQAGLIDLKAMGEMEKTCFPLDAWPLIEQIAALTFPGMVRIKAVVDGRMIGFVGGDIRRSQQVGWISTLSVLPEFRRKGVALALLDACEKEMQMPNVKLAVRRSNFDAQALYFKTGYRQKDIWAKYYDGGEDAIILEKELPEFKNVEH